MALQIRVSVPDFASGINFTDSIILENAGNISLKKTVSSTDESISFTLPLTDPKLPYITYLRWWECWDTETNLRKNFGPIENITRVGGESKKITGPGRSAILGDFYKTVQTFYRPIDQFLEDLRFENLIAGPRVSTIINKNTKSEYYGLSLRTKDFAIDENTGYLAPGKDTPETSTIKASEYWSGIDKADYLIIDLGEEVTISKLKLLFPWWGGPTINNGRHYDWQLSYSNDDLTYTPFYTSPSPGNRTDPYTDGTAYYLGDTGFANDQETPSGVPITARYWKIDITKTQAIYGNFFTNTLYDAWDWECGGSNIINGNPAPSPTVATGTLIPKDNLTPSSDCHASIVEAGVYRKIIGTDTITNLAYHQIQNDNRQVTYYHVAEASEMITTETATVRKYEPGDFFRNVTFSGTAVTVTDEYNSELYTGNGAAIKLPAFTRMIKLSGDAASQVIFVDAWLGKTDAFSFAGGYSYTTVANDYATLDFRGVSLKWYATIPVGSTAADVKIEIRAKNSYGIWGSWSTLENSLTLPTGVSASKVWEITPESNLLAVDTSYQVKITNLNGGYVGIDAFAGYWTASMSTLNEDDARTKVRRPTDFTQLYGGKFLSGSVWKILGYTSTKSSVVFTGDRGIVYSRRGPGYGKLTIGMYEWPQLVKVYIPGGNSDGTYTIDLQHTTDIPQAVIFDTNEIFATPYDGLRWGTYAIGIYNFDDRTKPIWFDGISLHETSGLSVKFNTTTYLDILKSVSEALRMEWDITELGIKVVPRIGTDTNVIMAEGRGTTIKIEDVEDAQQVATMLLTQGADIDGLPLSTIVENKASKEIIGRTIQRTYDNLRNVSDYFTLIGASRTELLRRREPQKRITVTRVGTLGIELGDSFIVKTPDIETRVRANTINQSQSSSGNIWTLECTVWPVIV